MSASATLFAQFQANMNQHPQLSREMVFQVARQTFDLYFAQTQTMPMQMMMTAPTTKSKKGAGTVVGGVKTTPVQWSRILNSKDFGLTSFFKAEHATMKAGTPGLNYFTAVSQLRTMFESTERWTEYVEYVRTHHPEGAGLKDPSPRQVKTGATPTVGVMPAVSQLQQPVFVPIPVQVVPTAPTMATMSEPVHVAQTDGVCVTGTPQGF